MKFKKFAIVAVFGGLLSIPAVAEANTGVFQGGGTLFNFNQACRNGGWTQAIEMVTVRYQPNGVGNNASRDALAFYSPYWSVGFYTRSGRFTGQFQPVDHGGIFGGLMARWFDDDNPTELRINAINPRNVTVNTLGPVRIRGTIRNYSGIQNCNIRFDVIVQQRR